MIPNYTDSGLTNIMQDEKLRNDYMDTRYSRLEKGLSKSQDSGDAARMNGNKVWKREFVKKLISFVLVLVCLGGLFYCNKQNFSNFNSKNETGWTVLQGIYVKTESDYDVLIYEPKNGEEMYIFMSFTEECNFPNTLQTGDRIAVKIVIIEKNADIDTAQVFELEQLGDSSVTVDSDILSKIESLSEEFANTDAS